MPVAIDGVPVTPLQAIQEMNRRAGAQGVGRIDMVEDRLVGIKSREVYEAPGAMALITAHQELENVTVEREQARFKRTVGQRWTELVYDGLWFSPLKRSLDAFIDDTQRYVSGEIRMVLHGGRATVTGRRSDASLYDFNLATYDTGDTFDQSLAKGFIELYGLTAKLSAARDVRFGNGVDLGQRGKPATGPEPVPKAGREPSGPGPAREPVGRPVRRRPRGRPRGAEQVHALRLAAGAVRHRRVRSRTPACCTAPGCWTTPSSTGMVAALGRLRADVASGAFRPAPDDEDVHTALERGLIERAGAELGGKLRAGRSRNDQIATLVRMYLREQARTVVRGWCSTSSTRWSARPRSTAGVAMPGRTHLQHAQPVLLAHHLLAHAWPLLRDVERWVDWDRAGGSLAVRLGRARGLVARPRPGGGGRRARLRRPVENSIDGTASPATSSPSSRSSPR